MITVSDPCTNNGSFIWRIKRGDNGKDSYLFGTVHVPYTRVWDSISNQVKSAFINSDSVMFELDLLNPGTISDLADCQLLPNGLKLNEVIPNDLFQRLKRHLNYIRIKLPSWMSMDHRRRGLYSEYLFNAMTSNWERKRPIWIVLMINSLTESDVKSRGIPTLDVYLAQEANRLNKKTGSVERAKDNCMSLNALSINHSIYALNDTLSQHELIRRIKRNKRKKKKRHDMSGQSSIESINHGSNADVSLKEKSLLSIMPTDDLARHYNCGNLTFFINKESLITINIPSSSVHGEDIHGADDNISPNKDGLKVSSDETIASKIDNYIRTELIVGRNKKWTRKMVRLLRSNPNESYFFAFGAGHFLGNNSVVEMLKSIGFNVERVRN